MTEDGTAARQADMRGVRRFALLACLYSWPIFFAVDAWLVPRSFRAGDVAAGWLIALGGHLVAMAGPALAALVMWRRYHHEPPPAWRWGRRRHYLLAALAALALWALPGALGLAFSAAFHLRAPLESFAWVVIAVSLTAGWLAGMGEELGWTAYLLPRLAPHIGRSRALVVAGAIRGLWHWPVLCGPHIDRVLAGEESAGMLLVMAAVVAVQLMVSNALFGSLFGWVWYRTESVPLLGWMHQWFDAARDVTALVVIGFAGSLWFTALWGIPFYLVAGTLLMRVARDEQRNR